MMTSTTTTWSRKKKDNAPRGVFRHPSGVWAIRFTCGAGHLHKEKVGPLKSDAIRAYHDRRGRAHAESGWCPRVERDEARVAATPAITFTTYAERWLAEAITPHRKPRTRDYYRQVIEQHLEPVFGAMALQEIKPHQVRAFIAEKLGGKPCGKHERPAAGCEACVKPRARNTVKNAAATLRAILYQAQVDELIPSNPAARFGRFFDARHDAREHVTVLEPPDIARVLRSAAKWYPEQAVAVELLFTTGMREGELLGLQWDDFDWSRNLIDLRRTVAIRGGRLHVVTPKSGKLRTVDVPASLTRRLHELASVRQAEAAVDGVKASPWVCRSATDPDRPINDAWLRDRVWRPLLEKAEVRHVRVHDARHTYASLLLRRGVPIAYVKEQLGHSSIQVTVDLYGHFVPGADRHHVEGLADAIETAGIALEQGIGGAVELSRNFTGPGARERGKGDDAA
jgi:integrase